MHKFPEKLSNIPFVVGLFSMAPKSVEAALLTAFLMLASDTGEALELQTNMCNSLFEFEFDLPNSFFLVDPIDKLDRTGFGVGYADVAVVVYNSLLLLFVLFFNFSSSCPDTAVGFGLASLLENMA